MLKKGDLFEFGGKKYLALRDSYYKFVQDSDAYNFKYDYGTVQQFVTVQPVDPVGQILTIKVVAKQINVVSSAV